MNESRNIHGWIINKTTDENGAELYKAKKQGATLIGSREQIINSINDLEEAIEHKCINCKYFHQLKELDKGIWHVKSCCTMLPQTEDGYEAFVLIVTPKDSCEEWQKGSDKWLTKI